MDFMPFIRKGAKIMRDEAESKKEKAAEKKNPALEAREGETKKTGTYKGKSNELGYGGRAQQLRDKGVPEGVIGAIARSKGAAPGQPNYHSKKGK